MKKYLLFLSATLICHTPQGSLASFKITTCGAILGVLSMEKTISEPYKVVITGKTNIETFLKKYEERRDFLREKLNEKQAWKNTKGFLYFNVPFAALLESLAGSLFYGSVYFAHQNNVGSAREAAVAGSLLILSGVVVSPDVPVRYFIARDHSMDDTLVLANGIVESGMNQTLRNSIQVTWSEKATLRLRSAVPS